MSLLFMVSGICDAAVLALRIVVKRHSGGIAACTFCLWHKATTSGLGFFFQFCPQER